MAQDRPPKRTAPFSLRLTFEERAKLERDAAGQSLAAYVKEVLFGPDASAKSKRGKTPVKDHQALAQVLAILGASRIASNLNQLAYAANISALTVDDATRAQIDEAYQGVRDMRRLLMDGLGVDAKVKTQQRPKKPTPSTVKTQPALSAPPSSSSSSSSVKKPFSFRAQGREPRS